jgi:hypothetical protein|eukprot:COSAG01_NODE_1955_length_8791_cov_6.011474_14_plen_97_part_00
MCRQRCTQPATGTWETPLDGIESSACKPGGKQRAYLTAGGKAGPVYRETASGSSGRAQCQQRCGAARAAKGAAGASQGAGFCAVPPVTCGQGREAR